MLLVGFFYRSVTLNDLGAVDGRRRFRCRTLNLHRLRANVDGIGCETAICRQRVNSTRVPLQLATDVEVLGGTADFGPPPMVRATCSWSRRFGIWRDAKVRKKKVCCPKARHVPRFTFFYRLSLLATDSFLFAQDEKTTRDNKNREKEKKRERATMEPEDLADELVAHIIGYLEARDLHACLLSNPFWWRGIDPTSLARRIVEAPSWAGPRDLLEAGNAMAVCGLVAIGRLDLADFTWAPTHAASRGFMDLLVALHRLGAPGFGRATMDLAAGAGRLDIVRFLHAERTEGCSKRAMDFAAAGGHLAMVRFLHENRQEGCTSSALYRAAANGHADVVGFLVENRTETCFSGALCRALERGDARVAAALLQCPTDRWSDSFFLGRIPYAAAMMADCPTDLDDIARRFLSFRPSVQEHGTVSVDGQGQKREKRLERFKARCADALGKRGRFDALETLLRHDFVPALASKAIEHAVAAGRCDVARHLYALGARPDVGAADAAATRGDMDSLRWILAGQFRDRVACCGRAGFVGAAQKGHLPIVSLLCARSPQTASSHAACMLDASLLGGRRLTAEWLLQRFGAHVDGASLSGTRMGMALASKSMPTIVMWAAHIQRTHAVRIGAHLDTIVAAVHHGTDDVDQRRVVLDAMVGGDLVGACALSSVFATRVVRTHLKAIECWTGPRRSRAYLDAHANAFAKHAGRVGHIEFLDWFTCTAFGHRDVTRLLGDALVGAAKHGQTNVIMRVFGYHRSLDSTSVINKARVIEKAVVGGNMETLRLLCDLWPDSNRVISQKAHSVAVSRRHIEALRYLYRRDMLPPVSYGAMARAIDMHHLPMVRLFYRARSYFDGEWALDHARLVRHQAIARWLAEAIKYGARRLPHPDDIVIRRFDCASVPSGSIVLMMGKRRTGKATALLNMMQRIGAKGNPFSSTQIRWPLYQ